MNNKCLVRIFFISFITFINTSYLSAQGTPIDEFNAARELVENGKLELALEKIKNLTDKYPENTDYQIYLGRLYAWTSNYEASENILRSLYEAAPDNEEIYLALLNTLLWSEKNLAVLELTDQEIPKFAKSQNRIVIIQLQAFLKLERKEEGLSLIEKIETKKGYNTEELQYLKTQFLLLNKNEVSLQFVNTSFTNAGINPWYLASFSYLRKWEKSPTEFKVNYGNIAGNRDLQLEVESYPKIGKKGYLYTNIAVSSDVIFPELKGGLEYFHSFQSGISSSLGLRYMQFSAVEQYIYIFTAHVNKLYESYNFQYRPYYSLQGGDFFPSHTVMVKKNWFNRESFLQLDLQYGRIPYYFFISDDFSRVASTRVGLQYQIRAASNWFLLAGVLYEYEEYSPENFRNRINMNLKISRRF